MKSASIGAELRRKRRFTPHALSLYLLVLPSVLLLFTFNYIPMYGLVISFQNYNVFGGITKSPWVGISNYVKFLTDSTFWKVMRNTLILNGYDIAFGFTAPILFALLVNEIALMRFKKTVQVISYLPHFVSWVVVFGIMHAVLSPDADGFVNFFVVHLFHRDPIYFLAEERLFRGILVGVNIWKSMGYQAILYFAALAGIDSTLYEAASIDGANRVRQTLHVTLPSLVPIIVLMFLLTISSIFNIGFERVFLFYNPLVYDVGDVISTYIYRIGLFGGQYSLTTAIGFVQGLLGFALLYVSNRAAKSLTGLGLY